VLFEMLIVVALLGSSLWRSFSTRTMPSVKEAIMCTNLMCTRQAHIPELRAQASDGVESVCKYVVHKCSVHVWASHVSKRSCPKCAKTPAPEIKQKGSARRQHKDTTHVSSDTTPRDTPSEPQPICKPCTCLSPCL